MLHLIILFAVLVIAVVVIWYLLQQLPLPEPAGNIIKIAIVVVVAVIVIGVLLSLDTHGGIGLSLR